MAKKREERVFNWRGLGFLVGAIILIYLVWFLFFSYRECDSWSCFNSRLEDCSKTKFIGGSRMIFEYTIRGRSGESCNVDVELLKGELNNQEQIKLEGHKMSCELPLGVIILPESNLGNCHGRLREGLQDIIIKKLHTYLLENVGRINLEVLDVPSS